MNTPLSKRVVAGLWFIQYITERELRELAWAAGLSEVDYGLLFSDNAQVVELREKAVEKTIESLLKDRQILEILSVPAVMLRPTLLRELFKLNSEELLCTDFHVVCSEIRDIWESGILKPLYIDEEFGDLGTRHWKGAEILRVFERAVVTYSYDWDDFEGGVDESYLTYMYIWAEGFFNRKAVVEGIRLAGLHPIDPGYEDASNDVSIPHIGHYAAWRCLEIQTYELWRSCASQVDKDKALYAEKICGTRLEYTLALIARGFPIQVPTVFKSPYELFKKIPGSYADSESKFLPLLFELVARAIFRRYSKAGVKNYSVFHGVQLDKTWEDYPVTDEQNKWNSLVTAICWGQEVTEFHNGIGQAAYDRPVYLIRELYRIVRQEMINQDLIE